MQNKFADIEMHRLRMMRLQKGITQVELMKSCGIFHTTISRIENGWIKPTIEQKNRLSEALGVNSRWLFVKEENDDSV